MINILDKINKVNDLKKHYRDYKK